MNNETYFELMSKLAEVKNLWGSIINKLEDNEQDTLDEAA